MQNAPAEGVSAVESRPIQDQWFRLDQSPANRYSISTIGWRSNGPSFIAQIQSTPSISSSTNRVSWSERVWLFQSRPSFTIQRRGLVLLPLAARHGGAACHTAEHTLASYPITAHEYTIPKSTGRNTTQAHGRVGPRNSYRVSMQQRTRPWRRAITEQRSATGEQWWVHRMAPKSGNSLREFPWSRRRPTSTTET
jgi:hypothetical protein